MNLWYLLLLIPIALIIFVFVFINTDHFGTNWNELIIKDKNEVKDKKMSRKQTIQKLISKIDELSDQFSTLSRKYEQMSKDLEYLRFKQDIKGDFVFELVTYSVSCGESWHEYMMMVNYKKEDSTEGTAVCSPMYPTIKYLYNQQLETICNKQMRLPNIFDKITATKLNEGEYIIKLAAEKEYTIKAKYLYANLRKYSIEELTLDKCQELGFDINIDKGRKWFDV